MSGSPRHSAAASASVVATGESPSPPPSFLLDEDPLSLEVRQNEACTKVVLVTTWHRSDYDTCTMVPAVVLCDVIVPTSTCPPSREASTVPHAAIPNTPRPSTGPSQDLPNSGLTKWKGIIIAVGFTCVLVVIMIVCYRCWNKRRTHRVLQPDRAHRQQTGETANSQAEAGLGQPAPLELAEIATPLDTGYSNRSLPTSRQDSPVRSRDRSVQRTSHHSSERIANSALDRGLRLVPGAFPVSPPETGHQTRTRDDAELQARSDQSSDYASNTDPPSPCAFDMGDRSGR